MKPNRIIGNRCKWILSAVLFGGLLVPAHGVGTLDGVNHADESSAVEKRDPFWPIGYMPEESIRNVSQGSSVKTTVNSWSEAMKQVVINGVSSRMDNEYYAVINGDVKRVGDTVSVRLGNSIYTWAVDGIETPGSVKLRRLSVRQG